MKLAVLNINGKEQESLDLPDQIFGGRVNTDLLHQAIVMYLASKRQGTVNTKERADVSGGGIKPFRQKGTGRARAGSSRSPLWHHGGIVFGPHPRDFGYTLPKKIKKAALRESLNDKFQNNNLVCLADVTNPMNKTKEFAKVLTTLKLTGKVLFCLEGSDPTIERVSRNIGVVNIMRASDVNAYDVLKNKHLLVTKSAFGHLLARIISKDELEGIEVEVKKKRTTKATATAKAAKKAVKKQASKRSTKAKK